MITQSELKALLDYSPETGEFQWRTSGKGRPANLKAGTVTNHNYLSINICGKRYVAHRLVWLYVNGAFPAGELDHIDGNSLNNRIANLREATHQQNLSNLKTRIDNTSGYKGVTWNKQKMKWKVQVGPAGKRLQKHFADKEEAAAWYAEKAAELFGDFRRAV